MSSPLSALNLSTQGSRNSNIFEMEFGFNSLVLMTNPGRSIDFCGRLLWSSGNTTTT
jgi:hypothetical protein